MLNHLEFDKSDVAKEDLITLALIDLFKEIDVNGDGKRNKAIAAIHVVLSNF